VKIAITGGTGFIGSNLVPELARRGHQVCLLTRKISIEKAAVKLPGLPALSCDSYEDVVTALREFQPQMVIHLATTYVNKHTSEDIGRLCDSNISLGMNLLEAMRNCGICHILNLGSRWQHLGPGKDTPANLYAATKNAFQEILAYYGSKHGLSFANIELCDTFGRGDTRKKIVQLIIDACIGHKHLDLSPGGQILDLLCVEDVVDFISNKVEDLSFFGNGTIALSGEEVVLRELGNMVERLVGVDEYLHWGARPYRDDEVMVPPKFYTLLKINRHPLEYHLRKQYIDPQTIGGV